MIPIPGVNIVTNLIEVPGLNGSPLNFLIYGFVKDIQNLADVELPEKDKIVPYVPKIIPNFTDGDSAMEWLRRHGVTVVYQQNGLLDLGESDEIAAAVYHACSANGRVFNSRQVSMYISVIDEKDAYPEDPLDEPKYFGEGAKGIKDALSMSWKMVVCPYAINAGDADNIDSPYAMLRDEFIAVKNLEPVSASNNGTYLVMANTEVGLEIEDYTEDRNDVAKRCVAIAFPYENESYPLSQGGISAAIGMVIARNDIPFDNLPDFFDYGIPVPPNPSTYLDNSVVLEIQNKGWTPIRVENGQIVMPITLSYNIWDAITGLQRTSYRSFFDWVVIDLNKLSNWSFLKSSKLLGKRFQATNAGDSILGNQVVSVLLASDTQFYDREMFLYPPVKLKRTYVVVQDPDNPNAIRVKKTIVVAPTIDRMDVTQNVGTQLVSEFSVLNQ